MDRRELENLPREELIALAERAGVSRPRVLTKPELVDEIVSREARSPKERAKARGWLGRARDLLARVVEKGLNLPDAAQALRGGAPGTSWPPPPPPLPTVTLAEIYAAQGHVERAIETLDQVLAREPGHGEATALKARLEAELAARGRAPKAEPAAQSDEAPSSSEPAAEPAAVVHADASHAGAAASDAADAALDPLDDEDLPERYDVDEVVAIAVDPRTLYVYWEVRPTTLARARAAHADGSLALRLGSVSASWSGPVNETHDVRVDELHGDRYLRDVTPGAHLRVSIGWLAGDVFEPFAVGMEVTAPRVLPAENVAHAFGAWSPSPVAPFTRALPELLALSEARGGAAPARPLRVATPARAPVEAWSDGAETTLRRESTHAGEGGHMHVTVEEVRTRVVERLRRTGASELARDREVIEERTREILRRRFGGASELTRRS